MSQSALMEVELAALKWQDATSENQKVTAQTVNQSATLLMQLYAAAEKALDHLMHNSKDDPDGGYTPYDKKHPERYNPETMGKPPYDKDDKAYSSNLNIWQTTYNEVSQKWQNIENNINTPIQSLDQHESSLGNAAQEASQIAATVAQPSKIIASLLQSPL